MRVSNANETSNAAILPFWLELQRLALKFRGVKHRNLALNISWSERCVMKYDTERNCIASLFLCKTAFPLLLSRLEVTFAKLVTNDCSSSKIVKTEEETEEETDEEGLW